MNNTVYLKNCCNAELKFYSNVTCRLCWKCQSCETYGCDRQLYDKVFTDGKKPSGHAPVSTGMKGLVSKFLHHTTKAHGVTDSTGGYEPPGPGANPGGLIRGLDCGAVIMKVKQTTSVIMTEPVTLTVFCDNKNVKFNVQRVQPRGDIWACNIGPVDKPLVATITIDNQKLPLIITE